jgi:hypothetical protein
MFPEVPEAAGREFRVPARFAIFLWPRHACKVRVSVPWFAGRSPWRVGAYVNAP